MGNKQHVIQVPVDDEVYYEVVAFAKSLKSSCAAIMREAFLSYRREVREEELERQYREGYGKSPEDPLVGQAQVSVLGQVLNKENWSEKRRGMVGRASR